jgi:molybdopterin molybdotransferase
VTPFDTIVVVDWSARSAPSPAAPSADAIWIAVGSDTSYHRTRSGAETFLSDLLIRETAAGRRVLVGFDFAFGYPAGFARALTGVDDPLAVWDWIADHVSDGPDNQNTRFELANQINGQFPGTGPFWGRPAARDDLSELPMRKTEYGGFDLPEKRAIETLIPRAKTPWQLMGNGAVGSQVLLGLPMVSRLRAQFACAVWPFQDHTAPVVLAEIYPSLIDPVVHAIDGIKDAAQVRALAAAFTEMQSRGTLDALFDLPAEHIGAAQTQGWMLGAGHETALIAAARAALAPDIQPPRLKNDCFALPPGVDWTPVDTALDLLEQALSPVVSARSAPISDAGGRVLAGDITANRANPPAPNTAVDGYGFAHSVAQGEGRHVLPLIDGQAAAGGPFLGTVPPGSAIRILTGAILPDGVDTVVLEEDVTRADGQIAFWGPLKPGSNTRKAGEDVDAGAPVLSTGHRLRAPDLALLAATGHAQVPVYDRLRVGVLSTGDEIVQPGHATRPEHTHDANRPMLLELARQWDADPVDLGHVNDDRDLLRDRLNEAVTRADVILTSGGASAGDEDHVSALLGSEGHLNAWRIALKPGRPLVLAQWQGVPVFGLPGNPVAALVCSLIFARPAVSKLGGGGWVAPQAFTVPAAFSKNKKAGRREYLRARLNADGHAEAFKSEGSGRISGLSWADGLVELPDHAHQIALGDLVRFLPYTGFGV